MIFAPKKLSYKLAFPPLYFSFNSTIKIINTLTAKTVSYIILVPVAHSQLMTHT